MYRFRWKLPPALNHWPRLRRCAHFVDRQITLSPRSFQSIADFVPHLGNYDEVITGSDQVWFTAPVQYYDPLFFLDWPNEGTRRINYAPSVGGTESFKPYESEVKATLARYHRIGVRDAHTASLVGPLVTQPLIETVDPTFLHDFSKYGHCWSRCNWRTGASAARIQLTGPRPSQHGPRRGGLQRLHSVLKLIVLEHFSLRP